MLREKEHLVVARQLGLELYSVGTGRVVTHQPRPVPLIVPCRGHCNTGNSHKWSAYLTQHCPACRDS